ncbi:MAG: hypothetical protein HQL88_01755 [Magnetococcales bacterium]|nr:hypothetical protein [Magnetococcales bacterium]
MVYSKRSSTGGRYGWSLLLSGAVACLPVCSYAEIDWWPMQLRTELSPWRVSGASSYVVADRMSKDRRPIVDQTSVLEVNLSKMARGFVWRPWLLQWDAMLGLGVASMQYKAFSTAEVGAPESYDSLIRHAEGRSTVYVLPESRFPFKASYRRAQEDSSEGRPEGHARVGDTIGIAQSYQNQEQDMKVSVDAEHFRGRAGTKNISGFHGISLPSVDHHEEPSSVDSISVSAQKRLLKQAVDVLGRLVRANQQAPDVTNDTQDMMLNVNHRYEGAKNWSVTSMGSINNARYVIDSHPTSGDASTWQVQESGMVWKQISSFASWRSEGMPLAAVASMRVADNQNTNQTNSNANPVATGTGNRAVHAMLGGNYDISPAVHLGSTVMANQLTSRSAEGENSVQNALMGVQGSYSPESKPLGPLNYRWFSSGNLNQQLASGQSPRTELREQIGQGVFKDIPLTDTVSLNLSLTETGSSAQTSHTLPLWGINHMASGRFSHFHERGQNYLELSLADSRSMGANEGNAQMTSLQWNSDGSLWRDMRWRGNLTTQWSRRTMRSSASSAAGSDAANPEKVAETDRFASANISAQKPNLFGLRQMRFSSTVSVDVVDSLVPLGGLMGKDGLAERRSWLNMLDYQIGKLAARLTVGAVEMDTQRGGLNQEGLILLEFRRVFDVQL